MKVKTYPAYLSLGKEMFGERAAETSASTSYKSAVPLITGLGNGYKVRTVYDAQVDEMGEPALAPQERWYCARRRRQTE
jgi:hypothetical protein